MKTICILGSDGAGKSSTIPYICRNLESANKNVISVSTTRPVPGLLVSNYWREQLVSKDTTAFERFNAALSLYEANIAFHLSAIRNVNLVDYFLLDRGFSSMKTYNRINGIDQFSLIPKVDGAIYFTAPFEVLSERLSVRHSSDFQDNDYNFRKHVYELGEHDFIQLLAYSKTKGTIHDTSVNTISANALEISNWILAEVPS